VPDRPPSRRAQRARPANPRAAAGAAAAAEAAGAAAEAADLDLLSRGAIEIEGRLMSASNATLYCMVSLGDRQAVSAYLVSRAAGFGIVPPTVFRDGPFGPGMCQLWIDTDDSVDVIALSRRTDHAALRDMAVFDAVVNNADRKIGHLLPAPDGHLYGCDHGVCFAEEYKLRTVLWQWRGAGLPGRSVDALQRLRLCFETGNLADDLAGMLTAGEITATRERLDLLISHRVHPYPPEDWPAVPWPPV
jgi:uncharacterized repeat protein (TIGR03843 family)